jgi:hypothetical protein
VQFGVLEEITMANTPYNFALLTIAGERLL